MAYEVLIARTTIINKSFKTLDVDERFRPLFGGHNFVAPGRTEVRYPVTDEHFARLLTDCDKMYPQLIFIFSAQAIEEYR